jgi:hypothetical protein
MNRFDVARSATPFENSSSSGRYGYQPADTGVVVLFAKSSRLFEGSGRATEIGDVGAIIEFREARAAVGLGQMKPQAGDMVSLRFLEAGRSSNGRVIEVDLTSDPPFVEVEYVQLLSIAEIVTGSEPPSTSVHFVLIGSDVETQTLDLVGRRLYLLFELVEGVRAVSNATSTMQPEPEYAPPPILRRLSVESPADVLVALAPHLIDLMPLGLITAVLTAAFHLPAKRKEWLEGTGQKYANDVTKLEIEEKKLALKVKQEEAALRAGMMSAIRATFASSVISDEEISRMIDEFVLAPLRALGRSGVMSLHLREAPPDERDAS